MKIDLREKGITIISLVITVIILLILAGVTIRAITGDNGLIQKTKDTVELSKKAEYQEALDTIGLAVRLEASTKRLTPVEYMDKYKEALEEEISKNSLFKGTTYTMEDELTITVKTKEGYTYTIKEEGKLPEKINEEIKIAGRITDTDNDTNAKIRIEITYPGELKEITINGEEVEIPTAEEGVYVIEQTKTENGTYKIVAKDTDRGYREGEVVIDNLCWDMEIWNKEDMKRFRDLVNSGKKFTGRTVQLMDNIDLERENWEPIALGYKNDKLGIEYDKLFCGTLEGNKKIISNLYINSSEYLSVGLFATLEGTVQNVILENVDIYNGYDITESGYCPCTGGIVGSTWERINAKIINCGINSGSIKQVTLKSEESTEWKDIYVGGIAGLFDGNIISNCYNKASIYAKGPGTVYDSVYVGGVVGILSKNGGKLINCYNTGDVAGEQGHALVGGIVGGNVKTQNECSNSYSIGLLSVKSSVEMAKYSYKGGVLGRKGWIDYSPGGPVTNCYCLNNTTYSYNYWTAEGIKNTTEGVLDSNALKNSASTLGDAFISDPGGKNNGYPILAWELTKN